MRVVRFFHAALAATATLLAGNALAQPAPEYALKAAYIYNFAMFTEWPAKSLPDAAPITICVRADHLLRSALEDLLEKTVKNRRLTLRTWDAARNVRDCQIVVLDVADRDRWKNWRGQAGMQGVLSVSDEDLGIVGVVIVLEMEDGRLGFRVQSGAMREAGLALSARLLRLAKVVQ